MRIAVTGSSGLIGTALIDRLRTAGHEVVRLVRGPVHHASDIRWDPAVDHLDPWDLEGTDAVVHLAGAGIGDRRWGADRKRELLESRTRSTALLAETLAGLDRRPSLLISASAIGIYGDAGDRELTEDSPSGEGFLPGLCRAWEAAARPATEAGIRVAHPRTGIVLSAEGGALAKQLPLFRAGLGGRLGNGTQWMSWISLDDEVAALSWLLDHDLSGPVNLTAPQPVTNIEFTRALGAALHRPTVVPVPAFGVKLVLGREMAEELLFASARILPAALEESGFRWSHPTLDQALEASLAG